MVKHDIGVFMLLLFHTAHISSFLSEYTLASLCHCSSLSYCVATHHRLCQIQDWDILSGRRGRKEVESKEEEGEEERAKRERRRRN